MSSLNATQADGYYIPPNYFDSGAYKKKSVSQFNNGKPNNKGHNQYLQRSVVRFELPYDGFCQNPSCKAHVGKGTRFNAHKSHVDNYHSTKIWEFTTKCRVCATEKFVIRTNPKGRCFDYVAGIHKKVEEFDTRDAGTLGVIDTDYGNAIHPSLPTTTTTTTTHNDDNPLEKLEKRITGERKAMTERDAMQLLLNHNQTTMYNDASSNSALRATYRTMRNAKKRRLENAQRIGLGKGIELPDHDTVGTATEDGRCVRREFLRGKHGVKDDLSREKEMEKFASIRKASIFSGGCCHRRSKDTQVVSKNSLVIKAKAAAETSSNRASLNNNKNSYGKIKTHQITVKVKDVKTNVSNADVKDTNISKMDPISEKGSLLALGDYDSDSS